MTLKVLSTFALLAILYFNPSNTIKIIKPSAGLQCPIPDNKQCFVYYNQCYSDDECVAARGAGYKCCPEPGCGNECKVPGNCPEPEPIFCIQEYDECYSDDECFVGYGSGYKCCPQPGCGLTCKKAV